MLDIKLIRQNPSVLVDALRKRNIDLDVQSLLDLDKKRREKITQSESLVAQRNKLAKEVGVLKYKKEDASHLINQVSQTKEQEEELVSQAKDLEEELQKILSYIPNIPLSEVPQGIDENDNLEIKKVGDIPKFAFTPKDHVDLGLGLGMMDFETATAMSGSRFVILKKDLSLLERAIYNFMLDENTKNGYEEHSVPTLVNANAVFNTAQLPKFQEDLFMTTDGKYLIPTTEVPLTNIVANKRINFNNLPLRFTGLSQCYRSEVGATGRDTRGMIRQHQFYKVELVAISSPEKSSEELEYMLNTAENILQKLKLPYRVVLLCGGDMGFAAAKTYDIEVWMPSQNMYREISSCSNCTDFQARRLDAKLIEEKNSEFVHTLNGSGLAVGRTLVAILENYQQEDGTIIVPDILVPYMMGKVVIK